jgi:hypothetical protein
LAPFSKSVFVNSKLPKKIALNKGGVIYLVHKLRSDRVLNKALNRSLLSLAIAQFNFSINFS